MSVGIFYWVGILLLLCFSIFPYVGGLNGFESAQNGELWIITFVKPITDLLNSSKMGSDVLLPALLGILYILYVVISFVTAIVGTTRLFRITKRNPTNKWGYNRATRAMRIMGKCFSLMFFMMVTLVALGVVLLDGRPTLFFYLAFAVALFFHFIGNFRGCKVSIFEMTEDRFNPIERKRTLTRKISLARNTLQMVCIWLVLLLIDKLAPYGVSVFSFFKILDGGQQSLMDELLIPLLLLVALGALIATVAHATGSAEYSEYGEKAKGMKTCRNSAYVIAATGLLSAVLAVVAGVDKAATIALLGIFFVGVQWIFAEQMFAALAVKQEEIVAKSPEAKMTPVREKKVKEPKAKKQKGKNKIKNEKMVEELAAPGAVEELVPEVESVPEVEEVSEKVEEEKVSEPVTEYVRRDPTYFVPDFLTTPNFGEEKSAQPAFSSPVNSTPAFGSPVSSTPAFGVIENKLPDFLGAYSEMEKDDKEGVTEQETVERETDEDLEALRKKWLGTYDSVADHAPVLDTRLLAEQQVHCPNCDALLHVRFGWVKAKCSKCGTIFELRKRGHNNYY